MSNQKHKKYETLFVKRRRILRATTWITPTIIAASLPNHAIASSLVEPVPVVSCAKSSLTVPLNVEPIRCANSLSRAELQYIYLFCDNGTLKANVFPFEDEDGLPPIIDRMTEVWHIGMYILNQSDPGDGRPLGMGALFTPNADMRYYDTVADDGGQTGGVGTATYADFTNCFVDSTETISHPFESAEGLPYIATMTVELSGNIINTNSLQIDPA